MICNHCATEFGNVTLKVNQIFGLLSCMNIIEVNVLVSPLKVMNNPFVSEFFLEDENVLKEFQNSFLYIKVIKFSDHSLLVFKISLILVYQSIPLVNNTANVVEY
jgi:hypothetical protein